MSNFMTKLSDDTRERMAMEARVYALPCDYGIVYDDIKSHMWRYERYLQQVRASLNADVEKRL